MNSDSLSPHFSFVIYHGARGESSPTLHRFLKDVTSFFKRFPVNYEVLVVCEKGTHPQAELPSEAGENISLQFLKNTQKLGRAESLRQAIPLTQSENVIFGDSQLATPLADVFKILQTLLSDEKINIEWGYRDIKKMNQQSLRHRIEMLFSPILKERELGLAQDPLCEIGGLKKSRFLELSKNKALRFKGWYLGIYLSTLFVKEEVSTLKITDSGNSPEEYGNLRRRWEILKVCLLGI